MKAVETVSTDPGGAKKADIGGTEVTGNSVRLELLLDVASKPCRFGLDFVRSVAGADAAWSEAAT